MYKLHDQIQGSNYEEVGRKLSDPWTRPNIIGIYAGGAKVQQQEEQ